MMATGLITLRPVLTSGGGSWGPGVARVGEFETSSLSLNFRVKGEGNPKSKGERHWRASTRLARSVRY